MRTSSRHPRSLCLSSGRDSRPTMSLMARDVAADRTHPSRRCTLSEKPTAGWRSVFISGSAVGGGRRSSKSVDGHVGGESERREGGELSTAISERALTVSSDLESRRKGLLIRSSFGIDDLRATRILDNCRAQRNARIVAAAERQQSSIDCSPTFFARALSRIVRQEERKAARFSRLATILLSGATNTRNTAPPPPPPCRRFCRSGSRTNEASEQLQRAAVAITRQEESFRLASVQKSAVG